MRPGGTFDEVQIREHLANLLPDYAIPDWWLVMADLPRTGSGKIDRRSIADSATADVPSQMRD
jgi:fatty-acyl-CoA synthase